MRPEDEERRNRRAVVIGYAVGSGLGLLLKVGILFALDRKRRVPFVPLEVNESTPTSTPDNLQDA